MSERLSPIQPLPRSQHPPRSVKQRPHESPQDRRQEVLDAIQALTAQQDLPPTVREITEFCGMSSSSVAHYWLGILKHEGAVNWNPALTRTIRIVETPSVAVLTSREAADLIRSYTPSIEERVHLFILGREGYGATEHEIRDALCLGGDTVRPRVWSLMKRGVVVDSGARRKTASNRQARVVVAREWL